MANVLIALGLMNVPAKMDGPVKIVKKKWRCVQSLLAKMMQIVLTCSKIISVFVRKELMESNAR